MGNSDKQVENRIMPLMKGFPSKHRVKEEKEAIKNSGMYLSIKKYIQKIGHLTLFGMGVILLSQACYKPFYGRWALRGTPMMMPCPPPSSSKKMSIRTFI